MIINLKLQFVLIPQITFLSESGSYAESKLNNFLKDLTIDIQNQAFSLYINSDSCSISGPIN